MPGPTEVQTTDTDQDDRSNNYPRNQPEASVTARRKSRLKTGHNQTDSPPMDGLDLSIGGADEQIQGAESYDVPDRFHLKIAHMSVPTMAQIEYRAVGRIATRKMSNRKRPNTGRPRRPRPDSVRTSASGTRAA